MALQALKNINRSAPADAPKDFPAMLEKFKGEIARALPRHINPDRMARIALTAFRMTPKLGECDPRSVFAAVIQSSQLGLEVGLMGEAHLVPFKGQCQLIPGYTGLMKLARQSGLVQDIYAHEVRVKDKFTLKLGMERSLEHEPLTAPGGFPASDEERGEVAGFYAVAVFKDGSRTFVAMSRKEVEKIRDGSRGYQSAKQYKKESVWDTDFVAMGLKTVIRRLCKFLPKSPELATALAMDAVSEQGQAQNLDLNEVIEGNYAPVVDDEQGDAPDAEAATAVKPEATSQQVKGGKPETAAAQAAKAEGQGAGNGASLLDAAIKSMEKAKTVDALDEAYIRAEAEFTGVELETLMREYRRIKADLGSLI
ncbi:recombinase RecT [Azovibrio restrictus]|uniref:recombinase RecT n=1 Tax=Azovibrio restrictus TaxID=146938 RepID=UPI0026EBD273|nr:recombinase RecT [Azovibrio restrictus]